MNELDSFRSVMKTGKEVDVTLSGEWEPDLEEGAGSLVTEEETHPESLR